LWPLSHKKRLYINIERPYGFGVGLSIQSGQCEINYKYVMEKDTQLEFNEEYFMKQHGRYRKDPIDIDLGVVNDESKAWVYWMRKYGCQRCVIGFGYGGAQTGPPRSRLRRLIFPAWFAILASASPMLIVFLVSIKHRNMIDEGSNHAPQGICR